MGTERLLRTAVTGSAPADLERDEPDLGPAAPMPMALTVGPADDPAESAADRMADVALSRLRRWPAPPTAGDPAVPDHGQVQRSASGSAVGREGGALDDGTAGAIERERGRGRPLSGPVLGRMESAFGRSFAGVRMHDDAAAAALNGAVSARAFTTGQDIFFGGGEFAPDTPAGEHVLAHELAHVTQGGGAAPGLHRLFGKKKKKEAAALGGGTDPDAKGGGGATATVIDPSDTAGTEGLSDEAKAAFAAAKTYEASYGEVEEQVSAWVPVSQQKKISDIAGLGSRSKGDVDKRKVKDLLRAFIMMQYVTIIEKKIDPTTTSKGEFRALTSDERKMVDGKYYPKTLQNRDKWSGLVDKGPYAPETQSWLAAAGFGAAIVRTAPEKATDGGGPRIDVRATFIGGEILGAPRRMHLFIVYTSSEGEQTYFRGGPDENDFTVCDTGPYEPSSIDWDPSAPSVAVLKGEKAKLKVDGLVEAASQIDGMKVPYVAAKASPNAGGLGGLEAFVNGENCNSVAWTLLNRAGIPTKKPSGLHPGWGHVLGTYLKQGAQKMPPKEDNSAGVATKLEGGPTETIQIYSDRDGLDKLMTLPGGSDIELVRITGDIATIKFGPKATLGFTHADDVLVPKKPGRVFWVTGKKNSFHAITGTAGFADAGHPIEVLDPSFVVGQKGFVDVRYSDPYGGVFEGKLECKFLTDVDPASGGGAKALVDSGSASGGSASGEESASEPEKPVAKGKGGAVAVPKKAPVRDESADSEDSEEDEGGKGPSIKDFQTDQSIPLFQANGELHKFKATNGKSTAGATGKTKLLVDGRLMVEFIVHGQYFWIDDIKWKKIFGEKYPEA